MASIGNTDCQGTSSAPGIAIVGAGAAGCFAAVELAGLMPQARITVFESGKVPLSKVAVTGGGRCNITNSFRDVTRLEEVYPRGHRLVKKAFSVLGPEDTFRWWESAGVRLTVQDDQCVFPVSQDAMQVVRTLLRMMRERGVELRCGTRVLSVDGRSVVLSDGPQEFDAVLLTVGGKSLHALTQMLPGDVGITDPVPSLFTLRIGDDSLRSLMGTVVRDATLAIPGTPFRSRGALLLTDWGVSGPATLKLSSYAARCLADSQYRCKLLVGWMGSGEQAVRDLLAGMSGTADIRGKLVTSVHPEALSSRLWRHLLVRAGVPTDLRWADLSGRTLNRLVNTLCTDEYEVTGRAAFKEEFVTCGGVALPGVVSSTLECRAHPGLFFAGEVLDVDAVTGGFNLQAAWSTAALAARGIAAAVLSGQHETNQ